MPQQRALAAVEEAGVVGLFGAPAFLGVVEVVQTQADGFAGLGHHSSVSSTR